MKTVLIHYFTGTGNTYHAVKLLGDVLAQADYKAEYWNMEEGQFKGSTVYSLHIFAFPVYGFGMPMIAKKYIKGISPSNASKAAIISIGGQTGHSKGVLDSAFEGDALITASRILESKGFSIQVTELLGYPENWTQFFDPPNEEKQTEINQSQDKLLMDIADKIINSRHSLRIPPALPYFLGKITNYAYASAGRRLLGKMFIADEKCNGCGKCSRLCPVKNIETKGKTPKWKWHCEGCQRCINACPVKSIQTSTLRLVTMLAMQLVPIYLVISFNNKLPVNFAIDLLLYTIFAFILTAANDYIINILEQFAATRRIIQLNFTHKFKRYLSKDIQY